MDDNWKNQLERINSLQIAFQQAMQKTRRAIYIMNQEQRRRAELVNKYSDFEHRCDQLQKRIETEKANNKTVRVT